MTARRWLRLALLLNISGSAVLLDAQSSPEKGRCSVRGQEACSAVWRQADGQCRPQSRPMEPSNNWCLQPLADLSHDKAKTLSDAVLRNQLKKNRGKYLVGMLQRMSLAQLSDPSVFHHLIMHKENHLGLHMAGAGRWPGPWRSWGWSAAAAPLPPTVPLRGVELPGSDLSGLYDFSSCAVVASAGDLRGSGLGEEIDNHTVVIRFNAAPTKGYENDVGGKTTLRITNAAFSFFSENGAEESCLVRPRVGMFEVDRRSAARLLGHKALRSPCRRLMLSPQFEVYRRGMWASLVDGTHPNWSSGFMGVALALNVCGRVDAYGFTWGRTYYYDKVHMGGSVTKAETLSSTRKKARDGIHDEPAGVSSTHQWHLEQRCMSQLSSASGCFRLRSQ